MSFAYLGSPKVIFTHHSFKPRLIANLIAVEQLTPMHRSFLQQSVIIRWEKKETENRTDKNTSLPIFFVFGVESDSDPSWILPLPSTITSQPSCPWGQHTVQQTLGTLFLQLKSKLKYMKNSDIIRSTRIASLQKALRLYSVTRIPLQLKQRSAASTTLSYKPNASIFQGMQENNKTKETSTGISSIPSSCRCQ